MTIENSFEKRWRNRFEKFAQQGEDDAAIAGWSKTGLETRLRNFARAWRPPGPGTQEWLDAGCGAGTYSRFLAGRGAKVLGMDYSLPTILKARTRSAEVSNWSVGDVTRLPLAGRQFDGALCFGVTQALADSAPAVAELTRVVKPGGQVWVDALNAWCAWNIWHRLGRWITGKPPHLRYESPRTLRKLMMANGLTDIQLYWVPILPGRWQRFQPWLESRLSRGLIARVPLLGALMSHAFVLRGIRSRDGGHP